MKYAHELRGRGVKTQHFRLKKSITSPEKKSFVCHSTYGHHCVRHVYDDSMTMM